MQLTYYCSLTVSIMDSTLHSQTYIAKPLLHVMLHFTVKHLYQIYKLQHDVTLIPHKMEQDCLTVSKNQMNYSMSKSVYKDRKLGRRAHHSTPMFCRCSIMTQLCLTLSTL